MYNTHLTNGGECESYLASVYAELSAEDPVVDVDVPRDYTQWSTLAVAQYVLGVGINPWLISFVQNAHAPVFPQVVNSDWMKMKEDFMLHLQVLKVPVAQQLILLATSIAPSRYECVLRRELIAFSKRDSCFIWKQFVGCKELQQQPLLKRLWREWLDDISEILRVVVGEFPRHISDGHDLDRWRMLRMRLPPHARSLEDIIQHEDELYQCLEEHDISLTWSLRKSLLMDILRHRDISLEIKEIVQMYILPLERSDSYSQFVEVLSKVSQTLTLIGGESFSCSNQISSVEFPSRGVEYMYLTNEKILLLTF